MTRDATAVSVIIVSYNVRELLLECVGAVYASTGVGEPEVIVVDNASSDGSAEAVAERFPECCVVALEENVGFSKASNAGMEQSAGNHVLLLNPDTVMAPDVLRTMTAYLAAHADVGMVSCKLVTGDGSLDLACRRSFPSLWDGFCRASGLSALFPRSRTFARYNLTFLDENETHEVDAINGAFMLVRREALDHVGELDEDYFMYIEDLDWCYRFHQASWKVVYHPAATTVHLKGRSSRRRSTAMIRELFKSTEIFYRKHTFPRVNPLHRLLIRLGLSLWKATTLARNALRRDKRTRP